MPYRYSPEIEHLLRERSRVGDWSLLMDYVMLLPMRACIQRVCQAQVVVDGETTGEIHTGLLVLLGVTSEDTAEELSWLAEKIIHLRIFPDDEGKMNRSLIDVGGAMLIVSQFTLYGDCRKGRRPSFVTAAPPEQAERMYDEFVEYVAGQGVTVATGRFRAEMQVTLTNDGPVTLWIDSEDRVTYGSTIDS